VSQLAEPQQQTKGQSVIDSMKDESKEESANEKESDENINNKEDENEAPKQNGTVSKSADLKNQSSVIDNPLMNSEVIKENNENEKTETKAVSDQDEEDDKFFEDDEQENEKEHMENNVANPLQEEPEKEQMKPASQSDINKSNSELSSNGVVSLATKKQKRNLNQR